MTILESANGTVVTTVSIVDATGAVWALVDSPSSGMQIVRNGTVCVGTANVTQLVYANHLLYQENAAGGWWYYNASGGWNATSAPIAAPPVTPPLPVSATGPAVSGNFVNVDFGTLTGQTISSALWGVAWGAPSNNSFAALTDANFITAAQRIPIQYHRLNSDGGGYTELIFGDNGGTTANWNVMNNFIAHAPSIIPTGARITIGIGSNITRWSQAAYANICGQFVAYMKANFSMPIWGWEIGNEDTGAGGKNVADATYCAYFNAAAAAIHAVDPNAKIMGPVSTEYEGGLFTTFANSCAANIGTFVYHGYLGGGVTFSAADAMACNNPGQGRQGIPGTIGANGINNIAIAAIADPLGLGAVPICCGEWNLDGYNTAVDTNQTNYVGAVFGANWMLSAANSGSNNCMGAVWEYYQDNYYGLIGPNGLGAYQIAPLGYLLSKAGEVMWGSRVATTLATSGDLLSTLSVINGSRVAVMLINYSATTSYSGQIALSHWPSNKTGTASINLWEINAGSPSGSTAVIALTGGFTPSITIPAASVVILST